MQWQVTKPRYFRDGEVRPGVRVTDGVRAKVSIRVSIRVGRIRVRVRVGLIAVKLRKG